MMSHDSAKGKVIKEEVVKCTVERETIPKSPVDLKALRSNFEKSSHDRSTSKSTTAQKSTRRSHLNDGLPLVDGVDDDAVDESQPSMADVLDKFRKLERKGRSGKTQRWRSSSAERYPAHKVSDRMEGNAMYLEWDSPDGAPVQSQTMMLVDKFNQMQGKKRGRDSRKSMTFSTKVVDAEKPHRSASTKDVRPDVKKDHHSDDEEGEMPEEGTVQTLLAQWKALEKPAAKKPKKVWGGASASTASPTSASQKARISQTTVVGSQKSPGSTQKTLVVTQKSQVTPQKTPIISHKTPTTSQSVPSHPKIHDTAKVNTAHHQNIHASTDAVKRHEDPDDEENVNLDGITKNLTEKFRQLEMKNATHGTSSAKKNYRWDVKEPSPLGRSHSNVTRADVFVAVDKTTVTPPSSPDVEYNSGRAPDFGKQPDLVHEHSTVNGVQWNDDLDGMPASSQTKSLLAKFEAMRYQNV